MISEATIVAWVDEFGKMAERDPTGARALEENIKLQATLVETEPKFVAMIVTLLNRVKFENPLSAAIYVLSIYQLCRRKQNESDKLSEGMR